MDKNRNVAGDDWHLYISLQLWLTKSITRRRHICDEEAK